MYVISLIVKNEFGVMQRIMGEFTRNKINVESIVVGKCECPGRSRMVLAVNDRDAAELAAGKLQKLMDVFEISLVDEKMYTTFALMSTTDGAVGVVGQPAQVEDIIGRAKPEKYIVALNAL